MGTPALNRLVIHDCWDILDAPGKVLKFLRVVLLQVLAGLLHHRFKEPKASDSKVKQLRRQGPAQSTTVSVSVTSSPDSHWLIVFLAG